MPEPLKNIYSLKFFESYAHTMMQVIPGMDKTVFIKQIFDKQWESKELKQRIRHIAAVLKNHLPGNYKKNVSAIINIIQQLKNNGTNGGFEYMFFPDFIEQFGLDDLDTSLKAIEKITQFISCEFAIRPFLLKYPKEVMLQMQQWSKHSNFHVRRFSSEGCRPRLPWAMALPQFKKDSSPIFPILENLKNDPSLFVRKSVANNLNDISKDNPALVIELAKKWKGKTVETDWVVKHACRTLLKKADNNIYKIFGLNASSSCIVTNLKLDKRKLKIGERLGFSFNMEVKTEESSKIRIEYVVYYLKAGGKQNKKLFKLAENNFQPGLVYSFNRYQRFQDFTTRKHYPGKHKLGIIINGKELAVKEFSLFE